MARLLLVSLTSLFFSLSTPGQSNNVFYEKKTGGYTIYGTNPELYPISVSLDLQLINLLFSEGEQRLFVLPPHTTKMNIGELNVGEQNQRFSFNYKFVTAMGDVTRREDIDQQYIYDLPFEAGKRFLLYQGYNGATSHKNENALDFTMPEGTPLLAAREGMVVKVVQHNTISCGTEACEKYNNYIMIMHPDGSFANYVHIKPYGAARQVGDTVKKGEVIGYSGNTGWSTGPHLHFVCFIGNFGKRITLETEFKINKGEEVGLLIAGNWYLRDY